MCYIGQGVQQVTGRVPRRSFLLLLIIFGVVAIADNPSVCLRDVPVCGILLLQMLLWGCGCSSIDRADVISVVHSCYVLRIIGLVSEVRGSERWCRKTSLYGHYTAALYVCCLSGSCCYGTWSIGTQFVVPQFRWKPGDARVASIALITDSRASEARSNTASLAAYETVSKLCPTA
jgi:hypothetical protein